ncbi:pilus assembly protein TadD [Sphingobacteriaceae bacterium]|nr:pilus assembly protein TadD [Sphingobacteriaceae bacterium]
MISCGPDAAINQTKEKKDSLLYLNHSDSAKYVGMMTCRQCHQPIYNTFIETGMGKSFDIATTKKSSGDFSSASIYDKIADLHYKAYWDHDSLFIKEFRLAEKDTTHVRTEQVNYIIGSGQHTNSHMQSVNGYINQMPMTYYTQKKHWDLPPGFENGVNTRFSRKIGLECMSCHNGYPEFVLGSENKFKSVPNGIDCERCHGPGSIHVAERSTGSKIDTSKYIDYSIVNPAKLSIDAQFDICQRCHLQGNAVLKEDKSFYDFKPGQKLSDFISVFLPKYKNADEDFIMASHADRLKQSACFIKSYEKAGKQNSLKPYQGAMTCVTCHNPHVSVRNTNKNSFNDACMKCHAPASSLVEKAHRQLPAANLKNCVSCHMPSSGSTDIPHVSVHDHYIRKPITKKEKEKIKTFIGLYSVNEKNPDALTRTKAYIDQYSKFDQNPVYLDSALSILKTVKDAKKSLALQIQIYFIKQNFPQILNLINTYGEKKCDSFFVTKSFENKDAWTAYHIGEAFSNTGNTPSAVKWFTKAVALAPYNLDFRNKLGSNLAASNNMNGATEQFEFIMQENPKFVSAYSNLGYIKLTQGFPAEAFRLYTLGKKLDPDNEALLLNLAGYYMFMKDKVSAKKQLEILLKKNPKNQRAAMALQQLNRL